MNRDNEMLHDEPISLIRDVDGVHVEVALQWSANTYSDTLLGYANRYARCFTCRRRSPRGGVVCVRGACVCVFCVCVSE
jgi:hypothetical protein